MNRLGRIDWRALDDATPASSWVRGKDAVAFTNYVPSNDVAALIAGQVHGP
jgi:hypothetical protein